MPTLLTRKVDESQLQTENPCDFSDPSLNVMEEQQVTIEELRERCARYQELLASLQPPQDDIMFRASNFTTDSVRRLIEQSPDSYFIRVYYGIKENGEHGLFMASVAQDGALKTTDEDIYVEDCCLCPPRMNCPKDELLDWQP